VRDQIANNHWLTGGFDLSVMEERHFFTAHLHGSPAPVGTENPIRLDAAMESPKLAE